MAGSPHATVTSSILLRQAPVHILPAPLAVAMVTSLASAMRRSKRLKVLTKKKERNDEKAVDPEGLNKQRKAKQSETILYPPL